MHAEGDAGKFVQVARAYRQAPGVIGHRLFLDAVERGLVGKEKIIANPHVHRGKYRHWLFAPDQAPRSPEQASTGVQR